MTAPELQPPTQTNETGRPDVVFDPCTYIPDDVVRAAGFDPATRERDDTVAESTTFTCRFRAGELSTVLVVSTNQAFDENLAKFDFKPQQRRVDVNGREGVLIPQIGGETVCDVLLRTTVGTVFITRRQWDRSLDPCEDVVAIAESIEPTIGADN